MTCFCEREILSSKKINMLEIILIALIYNTTHSHVLMSLTLRTNHKTFSWYKSLAAPLTVKSKNTKWFVKFGETFSQRIWLSARNQSALFVIFHLNIYTVVSSQATDASSSVPIKLTFKFLQFSVLLLILVTWTLLSQERCSSEKSVS